MAHTDTGDPDNGSEHSEDESLGEQALKAIVKSQQLRERSRKLRGAAKESQEPPTSEPGPTS